MVCRPGRPLDRCLNRRKSQRSANQRTYCLSVGSVISKGVFKNLNLSMYKSNELARHGHSVCCTVVAAICATAGFPAVLRQCLRPWRPYSLCVPEQGTVRMKLRFCTFSSNPSGGRRPRLRRLDASTKVGWPMSQPKFGHRSRKRHDHA